MNHVQSTMSLFTAVALAVIAGGCAQEGENRSALPAVTGPSAIVQNHEGDQGCTPGFWKNHSWAGTPYDQGQTLESVFDVPDSLGLDNVTLLEALKTGGGGLQALLRHGVAALLNAASLQYPVPTFYVILAINTELASGDATSIETLKDQFDVWNNLHAPGFCD